jgi:diguanylate cyclase (GGDEF)-like protein
VESAASLREGDRVEVRRIVLVSRIAGVLVAVALVTAAFWVHRRSPGSASAVFAYFTVLVGLAAFVALSTLARIGHAKVLERSLVEVRHLTRQLREMAERDSLTGLFNLRAFHELTEQELHLARLEHRSVSLIVADLDNFKLLNDSFGHQFGDMVLCETGKVFAAAGPQGAVAARLGGDEFAIMLPGSTREDAVTTVSRIDARLRRQRLEDSRPGRSAASASPRSRAMATVCRRSSPRPTAACTARNTDARPRRWRRLRVPRASCSCASAGPCAPNRRPSRSCMRWLPRREKSSV